MITILQFYIFRPIDIISPQHCVTLNMSDSVFLCYFILFDLDKEGVRLIHKLIKYCNLLLVKLFNENENLKY